VLRRIVKNIFCSTVSRPPCCPLIGDIRPMRSLADAEHDISVDGPELAAQVIRADLVDEFQMIVCPAVVGGGKRFFPDDVRVELRCSRSAGSAAACSSCGTASAGLLVGLHQGVKSSEILPA
jgi:hypothetical protein